MPHPSDPAPEPAPEPRPPGDRPTAPALVIAVERSGGFAGLVRRWSVAPTADDAPRWRSLVEECPWESAADAAAGSAADAGADAAASAGADRFCWSLTAADGDRERAAQLGEHDVDGPWRVLIDAVRAAASAAEQ